MDGSVSFLAILLRKQWKEIVGNLRSAISSFYNWLCIRMTQKLVMYSHDTKKQVRTVDTNTCSREYHCHL